MTRVSLEKAARAIDARLGFHFPYERHADLERALAAAAADSGCDSPEAFIDLIESADCPAAVVDSLVGRISIGETYFFRHAEQFEALSTLALPPILAEKRDESCLSGKRPRLSIWCVAGSSGEEAYSIAILLRSLIPDIDLWDIFLASSDLNPAALVRARKAEYGEWSFRGVSESIRRTWFVRSRKGVFCPLPAVKSMVTIMPFNLAAADWNLPAAGILTPDIVFCRNVLLYFSPTGIEGVLGRLFRCMAMGGWLIVGPSEAMSVMGSKFMAVSLGNTTFFRKPAESETGKVSVVFSGGCGEDSLPTDAIVTLLAKGSSTRKAAPERGTLPVRQDKPGLAQYREARRLADLGMTTEAAAACDLALAADRTDPDYQYFSAILAMERRDLDVAAVVLRRVLYLKPDFIMAHCTLATVEKARGNRIESMRHYRNALVCLGDIADDAIVPESDGIPARRMAMDISRALGQKDKNHER